LSDYVAQQDALRPISHEAEDILRTAYGADLRGRLSAERFAATLGDYARIAAEQTSAPRLIGEALTREQVLTEAGARNAAAVQAAADTAGPALPGLGRGPRPGYGAGGPAPRRPGVGAPGPRVAAAAENAAPEQVGGVPGAVVAPPLDLLKPNFTPETRAQLREANRLYRIYKDTFRRGAVGDVLRSAPGPTGFRMPESAVPAALFRGGPQGAEAADSLIRATGSPEAAVALLGDYPAFAFRRAAEREGIIDPQRARAWLDRNAAALGKLPGLAPRFADAATASRAVGDASAAGAATVKAYQDSAARHYLTRGGQPVEPQDAVRSLLASDTASADAAKLMRLASGNQGAIDGLRRNLVDYMMTRLRSTEEAGTTGERQIAGAAFLRFVSSPKNQQVMRTILGPADAQRAIDIGTDIQRAMRSFNATKIPGSPGTAADFAAWLRGPGHGTPLIGQIFVGEMLGRLAEGAVGLGGAIATPLVVVGNAMRQHGLQTVADLTARAVLDPELARLLLERVPEPQAPEVARRLAQRLALIGVSAEASREAKR